MLDARIAQGRPWWAGEGLSMSLAPRVYCTEPMLFWPRRCMPALLCTIDDVARMVSGKLSGKPATLVKVANGGK